MDGRFSVSTVDGGVDNSGFQLHEHGAEKEDTVGEMMMNTTNLYETQPDTNSGRKSRRKSLAQLTREVLPRLENYRTSRRAPKRPSLGELHGDEVANKELQNADLNDPNAPSAHEGVKLGWIQGVLIPCLLNIFGVMLFLRLSWVVAEAGIGESLIIILISAVVCIITTLSLSAICTNGEVKGGGIYYIISRSLGPEFGASVGIVFAFANAVSASMNTIGFCNSLSDLLNNYGLKIIDGGINDARVVGVVATLVMILICAIGMEWESKAQNFLIVTIVVAMVDFMIGAIVGPQSEEQRARGFVGFSYATISENWNSNYRRSEGLDYDFFQVFAIFFPSVTGIQAGANISGDLKDPASAIPKGTFLALLISMISYATFVLFAGSVAIRDASGNISDLVGGNITNCAPDCKYGLFNNYQMMTIISSFGPLIYAGCFAATLSTALTNLLSVPRLIQALGIDRIYPGLIYFSKGYGKAGEPYRGYVLTFIVSVVFLLIGELNTIAPLISNFYLASYALINFCTFHAALIKPLGWRPTFKYYNTWLSLAGFVMCVVIMFLVNWISSLITFIVILMLYLVVVYRKPDVNWGSSTQAQTYKSALTTAHRLINVGEHVKNYKPQILVLSGPPSTRPILVDFANLITKNNSLLILGDIAPVTLQHKSRVSKIDKAYNWLRINKIKGFFTVIDNLSFENGANALVQSTGIGKLKPNVLMMGYKENWRSCKREELVCYFNVLHCAFDHRLAVAILRVKDGLDYGKLTLDDSSPTDNTLTSPSTNTGSDLGGLGTGNMMHADSNLSLDEIGKSQNSPTATSEGVKHKGNGLLNMTINKKHLPGNNGADNLEHVPPFVMDNLNLFRNKKNKGTIDVWWLYDDGGLTVLLPYIISTRQNWANCKLKIYALATNKSDLEAEEKSMSHLLSKFRIKYSSLKIVSISDKPQDSTIELFNNVLNDFRTKQEVDENDCKVTEAEISALQEKTYRQLRLRELLLENSQESNLIVMSLPMPRKGKLSAPLYMAWLEVLTKDLPPFLMVRGNQQSVLTFYS